MRNEITPARICLSLLLLMGLIGLVKPEFMPHAPAPYDKVLHFIIFAMVTSLAVLSFERIVFSALIAVMIFLGGVVVEIVQAMGPSRQPEIADVFTNFIGVISAFFLTCAFKKNKTQDILSNALRNEIQTLYVEEEKLGTPVHVRLEKIMRLYRREHPDTPSTQARLIVSEIIEDM